MQNLIPKLRQTSIISKKPEKNWKLWQALTTIEFNIFFAEILHTPFLLSNVYKRVCRIFFIFLKKSWVINKSVKKSVQKPDLFLIFANNSRFKQNKKNPAHPFVDIGK